MENFATLLALVAFFGILFGGIGIIKGNVKFLKLKSRKASSIFVVAMIVLFAIAGSLLPETNEHTAEPAIKDEKIKSEEKTSSEKVKENENNVIKDDKADSEKKSNTEQEDKPKKETKEEPDKQLATSEQQKQAETTKVSGNLSVHFVNVGQGAAQVVVTPNKKVMVIDGGNNDDEDDIVAYLKHLGIKKVDILVGTHPDADHIGGIDAVIDSFAIGKIYMPKVQRNTQTFESVLLSIQKKGLKVTTARAGLDLDLDKNVQLKMIAPIGTDSDANEMSAVIRMQYGNHSFLFTGDAGIPAEQKMINSGTTLASTVLLVGHHGSSNSTSKAFLQKVSPKYSVIQVGKNSYGHPTEEVLQRLHQSGSKIYRNDTDGTIVFTTNGKEMKVNKNAWVYKATTEKKDTSQKESEKPKQEQPKSSTNIIGTVKATASIDIPNPTSNQQVTVTVVAKDANGKPVSGADVTLLLHYKSKETTYTGITDANGKAILPFKIGRAAKGFTVKGDITVSYKGKKVHTTTQFTPQ
ncbi:MBL fold metallo-hydrolase [Bacillus kwashiorkori]|uniref:MBL fold metallo-hydrolase n=1 Tax=Bacillus kwashiorkori TaxID=1522318 RepID=UPI0007828571|nr:MBL fold metallo-hydrolase [Bacillus kwashiorkori]